MAELTFNRESTAPETIQRAAEVLRLAGRWAEATRRPSLQLELLDEWLRIATGAA